MAQVKIKVPLPNSHRGYEGWKPTVFWAQLINGGAHPSSFPALSIPDSNKVLMYCWVDRAFQSSNGKTWVDLTTF